MKLCTVLLCAAGGAILATSCSPLPRASAPLPPMQSGGSFWQGEGMSGPPSVRISLSHQRAYLYKGEQLAGMSPISSGREGLDTVTGSFHILQKDREHRSSLFGHYLDESGTVLRKDVDTSKDPMPPGAHFEGADMPCWMRITGGTGMHAGYLPGYPDSHGCIRMPAVMAEAFFNSVSVGTPVRIEP